MESKYKQISKVSGDRWDATVKEYQYILDNNIEGDIVELGCYRGGMMCGLMEIGIKEKDSRKFWLYDTFEGLPRPKEEDYKIGNTYKDTLNKWEDRQKKVSWCYADYNEVYDRVNNLGYNNVELIKGKVEDTLSNNHPDKISILRLDMDYYEPTKLALNILANKVTHCIVVDDYNVWSGVNKAIDEFLQDTNKRFILTGNKGMVIYEI